MDLPQGNCLEEGLEWNIASLHTLELSEAYLLVYLRSDIGVYQAQVALAWSRAPSDPFGLESATGSLFCVPRCRQFSCGLEHSVL